MPQRIPTRILSVSGNGTTFTSPNCPVSSSYFQSGFEQGWSSDLWSVDGDLIGIHAERTVAPGGTASEVYTFRKGTGTGAASDTAASVTFGAGDTVATWTGSVALTDNDWTSLKRVGANSPATGDVFITYIFLPTDGLSSNYGHGSWNGRSAGVPGAILSVAGGPSGFGAGSSSPVGLHELPMTIAGAFTKLRFAIDVVDAVDTHVLAYLNGVPQDGSGGTVDTRAVIAAGQTLGSVTCNLPISPGDLVATRRALTGGNRGLRFGARFTATTPGEFMIGGGIETNQPSQSANSSSLAGGSSHAWTSTETNVELSVGPLGIRALGLTVYLNSPPDAGAYQYTLRRRIPPGSFADTSITGSLSGLGSGPGFTRLAVSGDVTYGANDRLGIRVVPVPPGAPSVARTFWTLGFGDPVPALLSVTQHVREIFVDEDEDLDEVTECTGDGEVAEAENPADGVSLATTTAPLYWMEVTLNDGSPATVYRWAQMAIPYGPPKEARVLRFGTLTRALSDIDGGFESATITSELQDIDGTIRAAWVSGTLRGARVDYYCADLATLQADGAPDRRFRGYISKCEPAGDRTFRLTVEDALTSRLNAIDGQDLQAPTQLIEDNLADLPRSAEFYDRPAPLLFGSITDEFGAWECPWVGTAELDGELLEWFLVSMAVVIVNEAFLAGLGATADVRQQVTPDDFPAGRPFAPGKPDWIEANDWSVRDSRRWTLVAGRADDPAIILAKEGTIPLVVNVCGLVADQSLSSSPNGTVNSPALALLLYANNYLVQDALTDFLPILLDDDVPIFDTDSFQAVHDALEAMADSGYEPAIAGALGGDFQQRSWRDRVAEFCKSFGYDIGINHHGQAILSVLDTTQGGSAFSFTADTILEGSVRFPTRLPVENEIRYVHTENYLTPLGLLTPEPESRLPRDTVSSQWLSGMQVVRDEASISALGGSPRGRRRSAIQEYTLSRNAAQSAAVAQRRLDLLSPPNGRIEVALSLSIRHGCELELGQVGDVEHWDLPWTGSRRCRVMRLEEDMDNLTIQGTFRDSEDLLP